MTNWKLGSNQRDVLRSLREHSGWPGGWYWGSQSLTIRILDGLVKRSLVRKIDVAMPGMPTRYEITDAGREALEALGGIYADRSKPKIKTDREIEAEIIEGMSPNALKVEFETTMKSIGGTANLASLADLAQHAGKIWREMVGRGIEFR